MCVQLSDFPTEMTPATRFAVPPCFVHSRAGIVIAPCLEVWGYKLCRKIARVLKPVQQLWTGAR